MSFIKAIKLVPADSDILSGGFQLTQGSWDIEDEIGVIALRDRGSAPAGAGWITMHDNTLNDLVVKTSWIHTTGTARCSTYFRFVDVDNWWRVDIDSDKNQLDLVESVAGVRTEIVSAVDISAVFGDNTTTDHVLRVNGTTVEYWIEGTRYINYTTLDTHLAGTSFGYGRAGGSGALRPFDPIYSDDTTLTDLVIAPNTSDPVITIAEPVLNLTVGDNYTPSATAVDSNGANITPWIETKDSDGTPYTPIDTSVEGGPFTVLFTVLDNNFNEGLATQTVNVTDGVADIPTSNRVGQLSQNIARKDSQMSITINGETGTTIRKVRAHNEADASDLLIDQEVTFQNGEAIVDVDKEAGFKYTGTVLDGPYPQSNGMVLVGSTTGELICYANEALLNQTVMPSSGIVAIQNTLLEGNPLLTFKTAKGGSATYDEGTLVYSPDGQFDSLDPGETDTDSFTYLIGGNNLVTVEIKILASQAVGANIVLNSNDTVINANYPEGDTFEVSFDVSGRTQGTVRPETNGDTPFIPSYSMAENGREVWHLKIPANCTSITLEESVGFDGTISNVRVREVLKPDTVVAPRKVDVHVVNERQQPANTTVEGSCVIEPVLVPIVDPTVGVTDYVENKSNEVLGPVNGRLGFRSDVRGNFKFVDCESYEKKEAISLQAGGPLNYVDNLFAEGGFPTTEASRWEFERGVQFGTRSNDTTDEGYLLNTYIDMKLDSIDGVYTSATNSDSFLVNRKVPQDQTEISTYMFNNALYNAGDGNVDTKAVTVSNYLTSETAFLNFRTHAKNVCLLANTATKGYTGGSLASVALGVTDESSRILCWNFTVDGNRLVNKDDLVEGTVVRSGDDISDSARTETITILKTQPAIPDTLNSAFDEIECEYKLSADASWTALPKITVGHSGDLRFRPDLPSGQYDFRCRTVLRTQQSAWVTTTGVTI